jgi:hypothetical protein
MRLTEQDDSLKGQVQILFDDDNVLVVRLLTYKGACYYGSETRWCRESEYSFRSYSDDGAIYLFIDKPNGFKLNLYVNSDSSYWISDVRNKPVSLTSFKGNFPGQIELFEDLIGKKDFLQTLKQFVRGRASQSDIYMSDESIKTVFKKEPLAQSEVIIELDSNDEFFESLEINEHDAAMISFVDAGEWDFYDDHTVMEDFKEGYGGVLFEWLNEENMSKLKEIAKILVGDPVNMDNTAYRASLANSLLGLVGGYTEDLLNEWMFYRDQEMNQVASKSINEELNDFMEKIGFEIHMPFYEVSTTMANLLMWAARYGIEKIDAKSLFNRIASSQPILPGGWSEDYWKYDTGTTFPENHSFHDRAERYLDNILEAIKEKDNIQEFNKFRDKIMSKYELNTWYDTPKQPSEKYKIIGFGLEDEPMIHIKYFKKNGKMYVDKKMTEEEFYTFLHQPELFQ